MWTRVVSRQEWLKARLELIMFLPARQRGEVAASYADGGVMSIKGWPLTPPSRIGYFRTKCESTDARPPRASRRAKVWLQMIFR